MIREDRYIVIKRKDLDKIKDKISYELGYFEAVLELLPERQYVVVESDWPEYETVWKMIEDRVDGSS